MKANQSFRNADDAVSPVIAVILMVAITVVLAATVYVWVSGFGAQSGNPQKSISITSAGALSSGWKNYTVASGTSGMKYSDLTITVNGASRGSVTGGCASPSAMSTALAFSSGVSSKYEACTGAADPTNGIVSAGDVITIPSLSSGDTLRILDAQANAVMLTLTVG